MSDISFNEFDEAHRAETAKMMKEYGSFFVPVTGSVYDRVVDFRIPVEDNNFKFLYYHLERPPLVYDLMVLSTLFFGSTEFAYRLPSFLLGMLTIAVFIYFGLREKKVNPYAFILGLICLITSADLWLSSQYAQLDTGLTAFLFLSLLSLITYLENKKESFLAISAISFSLAILSKGQPAVIFLPVIAFLLLKKEMKWKVLLRYLGYSLVVLLPWLLYVSIKFGPLTFFKIFTGFAYVTTVTDELHHKAPIFWYARWWWETLRPGWSLFLVFATYDFIKKNISTQKLILLTFILVNFVWLSIPNNKLWWYVLPLVPAICYYIYLSCSDYLKEDSQKIINLSIALIIASRPPLSGVSNTIAILYGSFFTGLIFLILFQLQIQSIRLQIKKIAPTLNRKVFFTAAIIFCLASFYIRFPEIIPYHWNIKTVSNYFVNLPGDKCLWFYDIPAESALFYSNTEEIYPFTGSSKPFGHCINYLMTAGRFPTLTLEYQKGTMKLYKF